jgi:hypothetical protein
LRDAAGHASILPVAPWRLRSSSRAGNCSA